MEYLQYSIPSYFKVMLINDSVKNVHGIAILENPNYCSFPAEKKMSGWHKKNN